MTDLQGLNIRLVDLADDDEAAFSEVTRAARDDLMELDVEAVRPLTASEVPANAKGIGAATGWLAVHLVSLDGLRSVVDAMRDFAGRSRRTIEITLGGDTLKVSGVSSAQQDRLIADWLGRHAADQSAVGPEA